MDFAFFPPEINSTRMYTGPGSGSLLAAAGSWDSLSAELGITAETYESVLSCLTVLYWRGPAAQSMAASAAPYIGWLYATAEQTRQSAMQARAAAAAYELAHAMTVPPLAVAANRTQLATLVATNFFGQNTPAIAQTEAQYAEYWAQDAAAMYGYAASAAAASTLIPFSSPRQTSNESGLTAQHAAVDKASSDATTSASQAAAEQSAAASQDANAFSALDLIEGVGVTFGGLSDLEGSVEEPVNACNDLRILPRIGPGGQDLGARGTGPDSGAVAGFASAVRGGAGLGDVTATLARADTIGRMSVPASWTSPPSGPVAALSENAFTPLQGTAGQAASGSGTAGVPGIPGGKVSRPSGVVPRYGARLTVMARPPAAG